MSSPSSPANIDASEVRLEFMFHAAPARVWQALVKETPQWWPKSFHTSERTKRFILEPKLGGMMGEVTGKDAGLVWYRVIGVEKPHYLLLAGYLLPPWAGPATSLLRLALTPVGSNETKFEVTDSTFGKVGDGGNADGWRQIFADHFQPHVERATRARKR